MFNGLRLPVWSIGWLLLLFAVGVVSRVLPLFDFDGRLLQQFPTEDGYLMLTVARNMAIDLGMSTSDGTIPTNGVQPFTTFVWALGYWLTGGSKVAGVVLRILFNCW